jgi:hypothetical protein
LVASWHIAKFYCKEKFGRSRLKLEPDSRSGAPLLPCDQPFSDPIKLPGRKPLVTLRDAAEYVMELPEVERRLRIG